MHNPNTTMCSPTNTYSNIKNPSIRSKNHMANVRKASYIKTFPKVTAHINVPENLYEEPPDLLDEMNYHRHSSPAATKLAEFGNNVSSSNMITKTGSLQLTTNRKTSKEKRNSKFALTPGDSIVSATSLIMAASPYLESRFVDGSRSLEDLFMSNQEYPFENLVFEGGGSKGMAYVGALQVCVIYIIKDVSIFYIVKTIYKHTLKETKTRKPFIVILRLRM